MKKILMAFAFIMATIGMASARSNYAHDASVLPQAARTTISNNFKAQVSLVKIEKQLGAIHEYEVILTDGSEISFDKNGNWDNVEVAKKNSVPAGFIPQEISKYVKTNHKGQRIVGIDKERNGYEIELSNGIDIKFDKAGKFLRYDD